MKVSEVHVSEKGGWKPEQGETIAGDITDIDVTEGAYGPYPVLDFELEDGTVNVHAFHDQLRRKLKSRGAQVGEFCSITYKGRAGNGTRTDAYLYDVRVGKQPKRFDYDALSYTDEPAKPKPRMRDANRGPYQGDVPGDREGLGKRVEDVEQEIADAEDAEKVPF